MSDWQARANINGEWVIIASGNAGPNIHRAALEAMARRNIRNCRLWELQGYGKWVETEETLINNSYDPNSPPRHDPPPAA